jgi:hypothetical protein
VVLSLTNVPTGNGNTKFSAFAQYWSFDLPGSPSFALNIFLYLYGKSVFSSLLALNIIDPHFPPFPPDGHHKGTPDSLLPFTIQSPHFPDSTLIETSS